MDYVIFFSDDQEYQAAIDTAGSNFIKMSPRAAATQFGIPYPYPTGNINAIPKGIYFLHPYIPGQPVEVPDPTGQTYDDNRTTMVYSAQVGNPNGSFFESVPSVALSWAGNIVKTGRPRHFAPLCRRRWLGGKELPGIYEGGTGVDYDNFCRDFSRTIDGFGFGIRGNSAVGVWNRKVDEFRSGLSVSNSWERFYVRVRNLPNGTDTGLWRTYGSPFTNAGIGLKLEVSGAVNFYSIDALNGQNDEGEVFVPVINEWYRVDILLNYGTGLANTGLAKIYVNGVRRFEYTDPATVNLGASSKHVSSSMGQWTVPYDQEVEVDFDDWINSDFPANLNSQTLEFINDNYSVDWQTGSHVRVHFARGYYQVQKPGPIPGTPWTPIPRSLGIVNIFPSPIPLGPEYEFKANTPFASIAGVSDALTQSERDSVITPVGVMGAVICVTSRTSTGADGQIGYQWAVNSPESISEYQTINQQIVDSPNTVAYLPDPSISLLGPVLGSGAIIPRQFAPWVIVHTKSDDNTTDVMGMLMSVAEYIGFWNKEDDLFGFDFPVSRLTNLHNCRWNNTAWGYVGAKPVPDVFAVGATYVGNGYYQQITLPGPCHFLWIRVVGAANPGSAGGLSPGIRFFGASASAHWGPSDQNSPGLRVWFDDADKQYKFSLFGEEMNSVSTLYQYVAFCDPGMRYNLCGAFRHGASSAVPKINPLVIPDFTPEAGFMQLDRTIGPTSSFTYNDGMWYKGPGFGGHAGASPQSYTLLNEFVTFGIGQFSSYSGIHKNEGPINYSLWRTRDGGDGSNVMIQLTSYTGDSLNFREIPLTPVSGRYPLLVLVFTASGGGISYSRDPSNIGALSTNMKTGEPQIDAISGVGIDKITVGAFCNAVGVTYSVFAICGGLTNSNGVFRPTYHSNSSILPYVIPSLPISVEKSGIYFINPNKASPHDSYYNDAELKIPDPTIRTALLGD